MKNKMAELMNFEIDPIESADKQGLNQQKSIQKSSIVKTEGSENQETLKSNESASNMDNFSIMLKEDFFNDEFKTKPQHEKINILSYVVKNIQELLQIQGRYVTK